MVIAHGLSINQYLAMGFGLQTRTGEENRDSLMLEVDLFWDRGSISKTTKSIYCAFTG